MKLKSLLLLLIIPSLAMAQEPGAWTLDRCVEYAVANSPKVNSSFAQNEIYRQDHKEAVGSLFPSISASTSGQFSFGRNVGDDNVYTNTTAFANSYSINGSLALFDGLASVYQVKMGKVGKLMGREELQRTKDDVAFSTIESFFLVQGYGEMVELCRQQLEESLTNLEQTERMAEVGLKGFPDVAEMKAQAAAAQYNLTKQQNLLNISIIQLKEKMNLPLDTEIEIVPYEGGPGIEPQAESAMSIYHFAERNNPVALEAQLQVDYSQYSYKATKGNMMPNIYLNGGYGTNFYRDMASGHNYEAFWDQLRNKRGHYLGFSLSVPIFSGFSRSASTKRSAYNVQIARNKADETLRTLYSDIEQAIADVNGQADEYMQAVRRTEAAELAYELNLRKYNEGLISAVELHTSSNRLLESRAEMTSSILMYHLKRKLLDYYKGIPFYDEAPAGSRK